MPTYIRQVSDDIQLTNSKVLSFAITLQLQHHTRTIVADRCQSPQLSYRKQISTLCNQLKAKQLITTNTTNIITTSIEKEVVHDSYYYHYHTTLYQISHANHINQYNQLLLRFFCFCILFYNTNATLKVELALNFQKVSGCEHTFYVRSSVYIRLPKETFINITYSEVGVPPHPPNHNVSCFNPISFGK